MTVHLLLTFAFFNKLDVHSLERILPPNPTTTYYYEYYYTAVTSSKILLL